jgi:hypothetical protein
MEACRQIRAPSALPQRSIPVPIEQEAVSKCNLRILCFKQLQFHNYKNKYARIFSAWLSRFFGSNIDIHRILSPWLSRFFDSNVDIHLILSPWLSRFFGSNIDIYLILSPWLSRFFGSNIDIHLIDRKSVV